MHSSVRSFATSPLDLVYENMTKILQTAEKHKVMVTIDMEDETRCQKTLDIFKDVFQPSGGFSSYFHRQDRDLYQDLKTSFLMTLGMKRDARKRWISLKTSGAGMNM
jgi:proline dehydrogenase